MELRHLRYFVAVAEAGSFSKAAQILFIAQPALSLQIRQLEDELGTTLLTRSSRGVTLTVSGQALLTEARNILRHAGLLKRIVSTADNISSVIRIGFVASSSHTILPRLIPKIRNKFPGINIIVREMTTQAQFAALLNGSIDLSIGRPPVTRSNIVIAADITESFCLAVAQNSPLAYAPSIDLSMLHDEPFIGFNRSNAPAYYDQIISLCISNGFSPKIEYEASTVHTMCDMVASGLGVSIVPASSILLRQHGFVLKLLKPITPTAVTSLALFRVRNEESSLISLVAQEVFTSLSELDADIRRAFDASARQRT